MGAVHPIGFTDEAVAAWRAEPRTTRGGQPWYSPLAILTALTLRAVFRLGLRQTEGLVGSILRLLGLDLAVPDHTTLSRRAATLEVPRSRSGSGPLHLLVDSTGLKLGGPGEWLVEKHGTRTRRAWRKLHLGVDAGTGRIEAVELTGHEVDDGSRVGPLLDQVDGPIASLTGDGACAAGGTALPGTATSDGGVADESAALGSSAAVSDVEAGVAAPVSATGERAGGAAQPVSPGDAGGAPPTISIVATTAHG